MSCYEWEHGTIKLPTGVAPKMRRALRETHNGLHDRTRQTLKDFWAENKTTSQKTLNERLRAFGEKVYRQRGPYGYSSGPKPEEEQALEILWSMADEGKPRAPKVSDVDNALGPKVTSKSNTFRVGYDASIHFDGNNVTWDVPTNNRARDHAHRHPMAQAFFSELNKVSWTRGTGGEFVGNDEYNRDSQDVGGGGNYKTGGYGPLGDPHWVPPVRPRRPASAAGHVTAQRVPVKASSDGKRAHVSTRLKRVT